MPVTRRALLAAALGAPLAAAPTPDLLIQGALDSELGPLIDALAGRRELRLHAWTYWTGRIGRRGVVIARTDIGPINAAASTALGIQHFRPRAIINQGTAGGHNRALNLWDIVLGEKTTDYAAFSATHADAGAGQDPDHWKPVPHRIRPNGGDAVPYPSFPGDPKLLEAAARIANPRGRVVKGNIGSAYQFNRQIDHIDWLHRTYGTDSEDMESAYAAGTALGMGVPFLAIRIISDTEWAHPVFEKVAGQYCAEFVLNFVKSL